MFGKRMLKLAVGATAAIGTVLGTTGAASAGTHAVHEVAYGAVYGKAAVANTTVIPLVWRGLVNAHGTFSADGPAPVKGQHHTFVTSKGNLEAVVSANPSDVQSSNTKTCHFTDLTTVHFNVVGSQSTGRFAWTWGSGVVKVYFAAYGPRYTSGPHKGQCNMSNNAQPLAKGAIATFLLTASLHRR
jgi:hypothetical protein